ncbi:hypothetical protein COL5a_008754 [Colletotrichum fioriniae]|nr:hypothetical protein COL5a_008754 [Colletotrichum fioriniae]
MEKNERNPFLDIDLLVKTAKDIHADAIHPGYGYLSENANFADSVRHAGLIFVGPPAKAMSTLGDKRSSKDYLRQNAPDVPLIPGFTGTSLEAEDLQRAAVDIGFPVMLKASAGGGGKERSQKLNAHLVQETVFWRSSLRTASILRSKWLETSMAK